MIIVALAVFGLILGSFVNALVWRLHEQDELAEKLHKLRASKKHNVKTEAKLMQLMRERSMVYGRSMCSHCHHELAAKDLVPLFSWLWLHGKCRYCGVRIQDNPLIEVVTAVLFAVSYISWPLVFTGVGLFQFVVWLIVLVSFVALAAYDMRWFILPDKIVFPLTALVVIEVVVTAIWTHQLANIWQPLLAGLIIFGLFWSLFQFSKGAWIGGGDVKLGFALGLLVGTPLHAFLVIFFASLIGTLVSIPVLLKGKDGLKVHIPFGPYLLVATVVVVLYGQSIVDWYQKLFLV